MGRKANLQPGQLVKEGQNLVAVVSKEKWIVANFKETQIQYLKIGQEVTIKLMPYLGKSTKVKLNLFPQQVALVSHCYHQIMLLETL